MISEKIVSAVNTMKRQADADQLTRCSFNRGCERLMSLADQVWQLENSSGPVVRPALTGENVVEVDFQGKRDAAR